VKEKKVQKRYNEEFKRQAVELLIHSGKRQAQVARERAGPATVQREAFGAKGPARPDQRALRP
jgi:transposase-like protein